MQKPASKLKTFRRQGITILLLLLALGSYFAVLVPAQRSFRIHRSFRVLADMSEQVQGALANLASSLENAVRVPSPAPLTDTGSSRILEAIARDRILATNTSSDLTNRIRSALGLVPNLQLLSVATKGSGGTTQETNATGLAIEVHGSGPGAWLRLEYRGGESDVYLVARSELSRLLEPIVNRGEFDEVLLLDTNGVALFQLGAAALQVTRLNVPFDRSFQTNQSNLAGTDYLLFAQPIQFTPSGGAQGSAPAATQWILCGLLRSDRFAAETRGVNYTVLVMFTFLALLLVLSWPFLNVWSLGLKGGLRLGEVFLLIFSTLAMNAFITLLVLDLFALTRIQGTLDRQLESFADDIQAHLETELRHIARQMAILNRRLLEKSNAVNQVEVLTRTNLVQALGPMVDPYPYFGMAIWIAAPSGEQLAKWTVKEQPTAMVNVGHRAYFRALAESRPWSMMVDGAPIQFCLEPIFSVNTGENLATFATRPPGDWRVVSTLDVRLLSLVNPVIPEGFGFCVLDASGRVLFHSDARRNLRENFFDECDRDPRLRAAVLGRQIDRFNVRYAGRNYSARVSPLKDLPWSLVTFRNEIVAGTAQVQMVSVAVLLFLLYLGAFAGAVGLSYLFCARRCLIWLWPSANRANAYGWLTILNLVFIAVFAGTLLLPVDRVWSLLASVVLPTVAVVLGLRMLSPGRMGSARLRLAAREIPLGLSSWRTGYVQVIGTLLLLVATLPMVAFFKTAFDMETSLLVKHVQLRLAQNLESRAQRLWSEIYGVTGAGGTRGRTLAVPNRREFFSQRLTNDWDVYSGFFFSSAVIWTTNGAAAAADQPAHQASFVERWLPRFRPHYNEQDVLTRGVAGTGADDGAWFWRSRVTNRSDRAAGAKPLRSLVLTKTAVHVPTRSTQHELHIISSGPDWGGPSWLWGVALFVLLGLPFFVSYVVADKVLLLNYAPPAGVAATLLDPQHMDSQTPLGPGKYLLLGPPRSGKSRQLVAERFIRLQAGAFHRLDLRNPDDQRRLDPAESVQLLRETDKAIVVDSFEHRHEDAEFTRKKLQFLRPLVFDESRTVVVVSNIHPLHFCLAAPPTENGKPESANASEVTAWLDVLAAFRRLYSQRRSTPGWSSAPEGLTSQQAKAHYRSLWWTCSPAEQELLHELADGRLISSYQPELGLLLERGLLRHEPALRLLDEPFRRFVLANYRARPVVPGAVEEVPGLWQSLKGPALTVLVILAAFFFITQREMWSSTTMLVTTFVTGIGALAKAVEVFQKTGRKPTTPE